MNVFSPLFVMCLQFIAVLFAAPAFAGWVRMVKCWFQGRKSAGLFQPYRDIFKLLHKDVVLAENASWIFRFTPFLCSALQFWQG